MKTKTLFLAVLAAFVMTGSVKAQITVNSSKVKIGTPLEIETLHAPDATLTFNVAKCGIEINNTIEMGGSIGTLSDGEQQGSYLNPNLYTCGAIMPTISNFMDLGTSTKRFRDVYARSPYYSGQTKSLSDVRYKENIQDLQESTSTLLRLRPVSFDFKADQEIVDTADRKGQVGFIAQEVQEILPHQVKYLSEIDVYMLDYVSMIPYLVKAFQEMYVVNEELREEVEELQEMVELLQEQLAINVSKKNAAPKADETEEATVSDKAVLYQNTPNPFSESTVIRYTLDKPADASLVVKDMKGRTVYKETLKKNNLSGEIEIPAGKLAPGLYTYSLIAAGRTLDSKKMVVIE